MNILILNYEYPPIGSGGGIISKYIAEGLSARQHSVTVLTAHYQGLNKEENFGNLKIIRLPSKRKNAHRSNPFEMISWIVHCKRFLPQLFSKEKFDACLANFALPGGEAALYAKRKFMLPYYVISHGHDIPWVKPYLPLLPLHFLSYLRIKRICKESVVNFVQTQDMKLNLDRFLGTENTAKNIIIPNGCNIMESGPESIRNNEAFNIIFVGRLVKQKDPLTFLKAVKIFAQTNSNFKVSIYGDGPLRKKLETYIRQAELKDKITLFGRVAKEEMASHYRTADVMVVSSVSEGMSLSALEAAASGVYLITTMVSGAKELILNQVNGEYFSTGNPLELALALTRHYKEKFKTNYSIPKELIGRIRKHFSWDAIVDEYEKELKFNLDDLNKKINVLHLIDTLWLGGAQTLVKGLIESRQPATGGKQSTVSSQQSATGSQQPADEHHLFVLRKTHPSVKVNHKNVKIYNSGSRYNPLPLFALAKLIKQKNIGVMHCHLPRSQVFGYILKRFIFPEIKLVFHEHGDIYEKGKLLPVLLGKFQVKVDLFIACSSALKCCLTQKSGIEETKIKVMHNYVNDVIFQPEKVCWNVCEEKEKLGFNRNDFVVGFAGRLVHRKGWREFLNAAAKMKSANVKFLIAGIGPEEMILKQQICDLHLENTVKFIGYVENMVWFYSLLDCCIIPSHWEGMPLVQLEAMAMGVPLVTTDGMGMDEAEAGPGPAFTQVAIASRLIVNVGDSDGLVQKIKWLMLNTKLRKTLIVHGVRRVKEMGVRSYIEKLDRVYQNL